jgi:hypothetical protein
MKDENFNLPGHAFKMLCEQFATAVKSVGLPSKIVVAPLIKQRDAPLQNSGMQAQAQAQAETTPTRHKLLSKKHRSNEFHIRARS